MYFRLCALLLTVGVRKGEALGLSWRDVDLDKSQLHVRHTLQRVDGKLQLLDPKTKTSNRVVVLPASIVSLLRQHRVRQASEQLHADPTEWIGNEWHLVFTSQVGTPIDDTAINHQICALLKKAGLGRIRIHDFRHTACALMLSQGVPVHVVSKILGHSSPTITLSVYSKVLPTQQDAAALAMDNLLFG